MTRRRIRTSIRALLRNECPYYRNGQCMESGNACPARYENRYAPVDGLMDCEPCLKNVLPVGWDMDDLISYALWYDGTDDSPAKEDS